MNESVKKLTPEQQSLIKQYFTGLEDEIFEDGIISLETEIEDRSLMLLVKNLDRNSDKIIDGNDYPTTANLKTELELLDTNNTDKIEEDDFRTGPLGDPLKPNSDGNGTKDLFDNEQLIWLHAPASGWYEIQPGVFINTRHKQIYLGDDSSGEIKLSDLLNSELLKFWGIKDLSQYTVIMDDDNGNSAKLVVDVSINELIIDNDLLTGSGEAKAEVVFSGAGRANSIWNDVDAVKADINVSITGVNGEAKITNTNDLDISEEVLASESDVTQIDEYTIKRILEAAQGRILEILKDNLNIKGTITTQGDSSQISNANFGQNVKVNVTDSRNFSSPSKTNVNLDVSMVIDGVKVDSAAAGNLNAGNSLKINLDSQGSGEITYGITGRVDQKIKNCQLGDEKEPPPPSPDDDPYNILEINVEDTARVNSQSSLTLERNQTIDNIEIGSGVKAETMPFINGTYVDSKFFGGKNAAGQNLTNISGNQKITNINNKSTTTTAEIRNENIWLADGEDSEKFRKMTLEEIRTLTRTHKFFRSNSHQIVARITGNYKAVNNGIDSKFPSEGGVIPEPINIQALIQKMQKVNSLIREAASVDTSTPKDNQISLDEFKQALKDQGLDEYQIETLYYFFAGNGRPMNYTEYNNFISQVPIIVNNQNQA